jgi:putative tricarboxylic transport membrane protein
VRGRGVALGFVGASAGYLALSLTYPFGSVARPGAGFFPVGVGVFLCLAATTVLLVGFRRAAAGAGPLEPAARARVVVTAAALAGFCLLVPWLGYPLCALAFVAVLLRRLGGAAWRGALVTAVLSAAVSYYVFAVLLAVPLPPGVWLD